MPIAATKDKLPLNGCLVERRKFMKLRVSDIASRTNIPNKYIKKIEAGIWLDLPPGVYARGFLKKYAAAVGLDENEVAGRYDTEVISMKELAGTVNGLESAAPEASTAKKYMLSFLKRVSVRTIIFSAIGIFIVAYIGWQFSAIFKKPYLDISYPAEDVSVAESKMAIEGKVSAGDTLTINGEPVYAESGGAFKKEIELLAGINTLEIKAVSRFGKESKIIRRVTYHQ